MDVASLRVKVVNEGLDSATRGLGDLSKNADKASKEIKNAERQSGMMSSTLSKLKGAAFGVFAGLSIGKLASDLTSTQRQFDILNAQLVTATGSTEAAAEQFKKLQDFAAQTPYDLGQAVGGFAQLKNLGLEPSMESMKSFGNTASAMGKSLNQMIEAVADASTGEFERLKEFGIKAKSEGDKVSFTFQGVTTTVGKNAKEIQDYLLAIGDTNFAGSMQNRMDTLDGAISNLGDSYSNLLLNISGTGVGDLLAKGVRGLSGVLDTLPDKLDSVLNKVKAFNEQYGVIDKLKTAWEGLKTAIEFVDGLIQPVVNFLGEHEELVKSFGAAVGIVAGGFLALQGSIAVITGVMGGLAAAFALVTSPITLTIAAITGLVTAGVYLYRNWDEIKAKASEVFGSLSEPVQAAVRVVGDLFTGMWEAIKLSFRVGWGIVKAVFTGNWNEIPKILEVGILAMKNIISVQFSKIKENLGVIWQSIKDKISTKWQEIKEDAIRYLDVLLIVLKGKFNEMKHNAKQKMVEIKNAIVSSLKSLPEKMRKMASDAVAGLVNGLKAKIGQVKSAAADLGKVAWGGVKDFLRIRSPSRKMAELGKHTADGMAKGIKDNAKVVKTEAQKMAEQAVETVKNSIASLKKEIALFGNDSPLASFQYDVSVGKYAGVPKSMLEQNAELIRQKQQLIKLDKEAKDAADALAKEQQRIAQANQSVLDSVAGINRQIALFNGNDALSGLMYDIENTDKYADVSAENMQKLIDKTKELQLLKDTQAANDAFYDLTDSLKTESPMAKIIAEYERHKKIVKEAKDFDIATEKERTDALIAIHQSYMDKKRDLLLTQSQNLFSGLSGLAKSFAGEQSGIYRTLFAIERGFAIAQSAIAIQQSIAKAMAVGFPQNLPLIGQAVSQGGQIMSAIRSVTMPVGQAHDGIMSVPKSGTWNLEKGERVLPAHTAKAMDRKLEQGGGTTVNIYNNAAGVEVEQKVNDDGSIDVKIEKRIKQSWNNLANPNSHESKMVSRNVQAPRKRV